MPAVAMASRSSIAPPATAGDPRRAASSMPRPSRAALLIGLPAAQRRSTPRTSRARFGADVATLVAGVARMDEIRAVPATGDADERAAQAERLRKMLLAMVEDIRVVLIKLAERTQALRFLVAGGDGARRDARATPRAKCRTSSRRSPIGSASGS